MLSCLQCITAQINPTSSKLQFSNPNGHTMNPSLFKTLSANSCSSTKATLEKLQNLEFSSNKVLVLRLLTSVTTTHAPINFVLQISSSEMTSNKHGPESHLISQKSSVTIATKWDTSLRTALHPDAHEIIIILRAPLILRTSLIIMQVRTHRPP